MNIPMNTTYEFEFYDGTTTTMTLTFYALLQLKSKNKTLYDRYNKIMTSMNKNSVDELDTITLLYVAYRCAHLDEEKVMSEEEFIIKCGCDRAAVGRAAKALTSAKKQKDSGNHSKTEQNNPKRPE